MALVILGAFTAKEFISDKFKSGRLHEKRAVATGNHLSICLKTEEKQENLCRDGRSRDLPDTH
jgi:hypothetical protein